MKTIVRSIDSVSLFLFSDDRDVRIKGRGTTVSKDGVVELSIPKLTSSNATLINVVEDKPDYYGHKFKHNGFTWSDNPDYVGTNNIFFAIDESVTTINVGDSNAFTASGTVEIDDEKITYTGVDGANLTGCTRGANSTSAASHSVDTTVIQI